MSSSAALKVLFALAVIWASYETSVALDNGSSEQGSSTVETESTDISTTQTATEIEQQATTSVEIAESTDVPATVSEVPSENRTDGATPVALSGSSHADQYEQANSSSPNAQEIFDTSEFNPPQGLQMSYDNEKQNERNETDANESYFEEIPDSSHGFSYEADMHTLSPPTFSGYIYKLDESSEGNLQDISGQESKIVNNLYLHFEPKKQKRKKTENRLNQPTVHITSYLADSETAISMDGTDILNDARNKTRGADMISAFFIAPDDEVNEIDKTKYSGRPIVVSDLNEDLVRNERYTGKEATKTLTNDILAPIQAALSLSHEEEGPIIEKQVLHKEPVYKTYIEIQKSIPYEIREVEEPKDQQQINNNNDLGLQSQFSNDVHQSVVNNEVVHQPQISTNELSTYTRSPVRSPVSMYYRYPMYYLPQSYIGNYIMRHSHENTGYNHVPVRPILPVHYVLARYQPQVYSTFLLTHPYYVTPTDTASTGQAQQDSVASYDADQNGLQAEQRPQYAPHAHGHYPPFRPSHPVYASQYPPYTYRVMSTMRSRSGHARTARSKQLCIEYGGFKPPMVPSVQIEDEELTEPVKDKTDSDEKASDS